MIPTRRESHGSVGVGHRGCPGWFRRPRSARNSGTGWTPALASAHAAPMTAHRPRRKRDDRLLVKVAVNAVALLVGGQPRAGVPLRLPDRQARGLGEDRRHRPRLRPGQQLHQADPEDPGDADRLPDDGPGRLRHQRGDAARHGLGRRARSENVRAGLQLLHRRLPAHWGYEAIGRAVVASIVISIVATVLEPASCCRARSSASSPALSGRRPRLPRLGTASRPPVRDPLGLHACHRPTRHPWRACSRRPARAGHAEPAARAP